MSDEHVMQGPGVPVLMESGADKPFASQYKQVGVLAGGGVLVDATNPNGFHSNGRGTAPPMSRPDGNLANGMPARAGTLPVKTMFYGVPEGTPGSQFLPGIGNVIIKDAPQEFTEGTFGAGSAPVKAAPVLMTKTGKARKPRNSIEKKLVALAAIEEIENKQLERAVTMFKATFQVNIGAGKPLKLTGKFDEVLRTDSGVVIFGQPLSENEVEIPQIEGSVDVSWPDDDGTVNSERLYPAGFSFSSQKRDVRYLVLLTKDFMQG